MDNSKFTAFVEKVDELRLEASGLGMWKTAYMLDKTLAQAKQDAELVASLNQQRDELIFPQSRALFRPSLFIAGEVMGAKNLIPNKPVNLAEEETCLDPDDKSGKYMLWSVWITMTIVALISTFLVL